MTKLIVACLFGLLLLVTVILSTGCANPYPALIDSARGVEVTFEAYSARVAPVSTHVATDVRRLEEQIRGELADLQELCVEAAK